ncbi:MAG: DUF2142 domain-containing protein [Chloroflexi bacterium]|nr:DUF2142 domain-containing protein [Chloroflexota bacterium]
MLKYLVLLHFLLAVTYGLIIPPYEAHDETGHFAYVRHIVVEGRRPNARSENKVFLDQSHQPPLYYMVAAAFTFWARPALIKAEAPPRNVFAFDGSNRRGTRILLRQLSEDWPWSAEIPALHAARLASALLSTIMLLVIASSARMIFPESPGVALLTTAIAAFNPQVIFMASMVNNDVMVALAGACILWALLRLSTSTPSMRSSIALGIALGTGLLSKNSALVLPPFAAVALCFIAWRNRWSIRTLLTRGITSFGIAALIVLPHYIDNYVAYGTILIDRSSDNKILTQQNLFVEGLSVGLRDAWLPQLFTNSFRTFWGAFGWGNVQQASWVYLLVLLLCIIGVIGAVIAARRAAPQQRTHLVLLIGMAGAMLLLPTYRAVSYQDPALLPGRYLMPALTAFAGLLAFGWSAFIQHRPRLHLTLSAFLFVWAATIPPLVLLPAYRPALQSPPNDTPLLRFADVAAVRILSAETVIVQDREGPRPYARVRVTWTALRRTTEPYVIGVAVLGRSNEVLGSLSTHPQRGNLPSTVWSPGDTFTDEFFVLLEKPCAQLPALGRIELAMFSIDERMQVRDKLSAVDNDGRNISPILGRFKVDAPTAPYPIWWQEPRARFAGAIALRDVLAPAQHPAGTPLQVQVNYELLLPLTRDAVVFVHATDANGKLVAQDDHAPLAGAYPTSLWDPGDCARETFTLALPQDFSGPLHLSTGWYDAAGRLRATTAVDPQQPTFADDIVPIANINIAR